MDSIELTIVAVVPAEPWLDMSVDGNAVDGCSVYVTDGTLFVAMVTCSPTQDMHLTLSDYPSHMILLH